MAKKVSKNQRTNRGQQPTKKMAKIVMAVKKGNGNYSFAQKMVEVDNVQAELKAVKTA